MTIPTEEEFKEAILCLENINADNLKPSDSFYLPTKGELTKLIDKVFIVVDEGNKKLETCNAIKWFNLQMKDTKIFKDHYRIGRSKIFTISEQKQHVEKYIWESQDPLILDDIYQSKNGNHSKEIKLKYFKRRLENWINAAQLKWDIGVYMALMDYFYSDRWKQVYKEYKTKKSRLIKAKKSLIELNKFTNDIIKPLKISGYVNRIKEQIEQQIYSNVETIYPIVRDDKTARERMLVYDLFMNNIKNSNARRTSIIYKMMTIEGIKNQVEPRTIERQIARLDKTQEIYRQKLKTYRQKMKDFKQTSVGQ